jgi:hypothetical protein
LLGVQGKTGTLTFGRDVAIRNPRLGAGQRIKGLHLVATDIAWQHGTGPEVSGTGGALLMAMAGQQDALSELSGPGQSTLADRVAR